MGDLKCRSIDQPSQELKLKHQVAQKLIKKKDLKLIKKGN